MQKILSDTKRFLHLAIIPFIICAILLIMILSNIDVAINYTFSVFSTNPNIATTRSFVEQMDILANESILFKILMILGDISLFIIGTFIFFMLLGVINGIVQAFCSPFIIDKIIKTMAKEQDIALIGYGSITKDLLFTLKEFAKLVFFLFICIPLFFVPLLNIFLFHLIMYKFFHNTLKRDISTYIFSQQEAYNLKPIYPYTLKLYLLNLVPILNMFVIVYQIVFITNKYLDMAKEMR